MREVHDPADLEAQFLAAKNEAQAAFGNGDVYLEKLVLRPLMWKFRFWQISMETVFLCANVTAHCSVGIKSFSKKLLSPALTDEIRRAMEVAAVKAVRATGYENAGTIAFLLDQDGNFYFMEMNTRVQVEYPVTEMITGTDIIKEQLRIAAGEPISCMDKVPLLPNGHAMEFRINAEDPDMDFRPCPETSLDLRFPLDLEFVSRPTLRKDLVFLLIMTLWLRNLLYGAMIEKNALPVESVP